MCDCVDGCTDIVGTGHAIWSRSNWGKRNSNHNRSGMIHSVSSNPQYAVHQTDAVTVQ
jgi:hypothetical protein